MTDVCDRMSNRNEKSDTDAQKTFTVCNKKKDAFPV